VFSIALFSSSQVKSVVSSPVCNLQAGFFFTTSLKNPDFQPKINSERLHTYIRTLLKRWQNATSWQ